MGIGTPEDYGFLLDHTRVDNASECNLESRLPFELNADDFINFAETNLKGDSSKDVVNALGNIKRAIENRMDCLLYVFGYSGVAKKWDFPTKIKKLNSLNIIAPRILIKINKIRNLLEHEYKCPKKESVEDALDAAILFLESTKNFIRRFVIHFAGDNKEKYLDLEFKDKGIAIEVGPKTGWYTVHEPGSKLKFYTDATQPNFDAWVKFAIRLVY